MSGQMGIGAMLARLSWRDTSDLIALVESQPEIESMRINDDNRLVIRFKDGRALQLFDSGQSCCEHRYMNTDDTVDLEDGEKLVNITVEAGPDEEREYGDVTESEFLRVHTNRSVYTFVNYNSHNGYYGGFGFGWHIEEA